MYVECTTACLVLSVRRPLYKLRTARFIYPFTVGASSFFLSSLGRTSFFLLPPREAFPAKRETFVSLRGVSKPLCFACGRTDGQLR